MHAVVSTPTFNPRVGTLAVEVRLEKTAMRSKKEGVLLEIMAMDLVFEALLLEFGAVLLVSRPILLENGAILLVFWPILLAKMGVRSRQKLHAFSERGHSSRAEGGVARR